MAGTVVGQVGVECTSCGQPLTGRYCAQCGEQVLDPGALYEVNEWAAVAISYSLGLWQVAYLAIAVRRFYFGDDAGSKRPRLYSIAAAFLIVVLNAVFVTAIQTVGVAIALQGL